MSITFDSQKWSNPLHERDAEKDGKWKGPVLVSLKDLNFFKNSGLIFDSDTLSENGASSIQTVEPPPGGRKMRTVTKSIIND